MAGLQHPEPFDGEQPLRLMEPQRRQVTDRGDPDRPREGSGQVGWAPGEVVRQIGHRDRLGEVFPQELRHPGRRIFKQ